MRIENTRNKQYAHDNYKQKDRAVTLRVHPQKIPFSVTGKQS